MMHPLAQSAAAYWIDAWQRTMLTWDVLHARGELSPQEEKRRRRVEQILGVDAPVPVPALKSA